MKKCAHGCQCGKFQIEQNPFYKSVLKLLVEQFAPCEYKPDLHFSEEHPHILREAINGKNPVKVGIVPTRPPPPPKSWKY